MTRRTLALLLLLAGVYTLLNAIKPLHVDDPFTFHVARQIATDPFDPFGSEIYWYQWPQPVHEDLLAPLVGYWGALGLEIVGDRPFAWKLLLFPFALLFALSLHRLVRRFASGLENWVVAATLFSPALLPSMNYMQDVPALALGLAALVLYLRAEDRGSAGIAIIAGLVAGLAMQTKWTQITIPGAMLLHGVLAGRIGLALLATLAASAVFAAWEAFMTNVYGHGMFLFQLDFPFFWTSRREMTVPFLRLLGALLPIPALLALAARGVSRRVVVALGLAVLGSVAMIVASPVQAEVYLAWGVLCVLMLIATSVSLIGRPSATRLREWIVTHRTDLFLLGWLVGEAITYFAISYFPAVRRVLATVIVSTLLLARAAARQRQVVSLPLAQLLAMQVVLGLAVWGVDLLEARAQREAAENAFRAVRQRDPEGTIWYVGHWGFQYYADSLGMQPVIPDHTTIRSGAWLVVPSRVDQQEIAITPDAFDRVAVLHVPSNIPLASVHGFYVGSTPLEHFRGPRMSVQIFRARRDVVPETNWPLEQIAEWALHAGGKQARWANHALIRALARAPSPDDRALAARALGAIAREDAAATGALERAAGSDAAPVVRDAAAQALAALRESAH